MHGIFSSSNGFTISPLAVTKWSENLEELTQEHSYLENSDTFIVENLFAKIDCII